MTTPGLPVRLGVVFPSYEIGTDPGVIRDWVQAAEQLGYTHVVFYDHVLGVDPARPGGWAGRYSKDHAFHEPMVLMGYLAACTSRIEFTTGILILPQRQTVLAAESKAASSAGSAGETALYAASASPHTGTADRRLVEDSAGAHLRGTQSRPAPVLRHESSARTVTALVSETASSVYENTLTALKTRCQTSAARRGG